MRARVLPSPNMSTDSPQGPSSLAEQRRLCGIVEDKSLDLLEAKPPWEGDLNEKQIKQARSALGDTASDISILGSRFRSTIKKIDNRLLKVHSALAGIQQYSDLKAALDKMYRLEEEMRTLAGEFETLAGHVK